MKRKQQLKWVIDILMSAALLCLMAYQITGNEAHEWIGMGALVLFILHNALNIKWYASLFKGRYTVLRAVRAAVDFGVLAAVTCSAVSGIAMSQSVFASAPEVLPAVTARVMHMSATYWSFALMSIHLGLHWNTVIGAAKRIAVKNGKLVFRYCARFAGLASAVYGLVCFVRADIAGYMLLKNQFVFLDFEKSAYSVFAEYIAMMSFFVFAAHYAARLMILVDKKNNTRKER